MRDFVFIFLFFCGQINLQLNADQLIHANKLIDLVIDAAKTRVKSSLEPVILQNEDRNIVLNLGLLNVTGSIHAYNGTLSGLSSIDRIGNATFLVEGQNSSVLLKLGAQNLTFNYDADISLQPITTKAHIIGTIQNITINSELDFDGLGDLRLQKFVIEEFKQILVEVQGNGIFDSVAQPLTDVAIMLARERIKAEITHIMDTVIGPLFEQIEGS